MTSTHNPAGHGAHPITAHLREAAEHLRLANHATHHDRRNAAELYDTLGELSELLGRLPQLVAHLAGIIDRAEPADFYDDRRENVAHTLRRAVIECDEVRFLLGRCRDHSAEAFSAIGHLGAAEHGD